MRKTAWVALFAMTAAACAGADPVATSVPVATTEAPMRATTVPPEPTSSSPTTTSAPSSTTTSLGPTVTYDPDVPRFGGEVVIADDQTPPTLNPYAPGGDNFIVSVIGQAHLARAYEVDPDTLQLIPDALVELPSVANGGVVVNADESIDVTWRLRPETRWADGVPMSGSDLEFTLLFRSASRECAEVETSWQPLPETEVISVGDKTVTARMAPSLEYETLIEWIVPSHDVAGSDFCAGWNNDMWVAGGPFQLTSWDRSGDRSILLSRNPNYWKVDDTGQKLPYLDRARFLFIPETEKIVSRFTNRKLDVIQPPPAIGGPWGLPVERWRDAGAVVEILPGPVWEHLNFQFGLNNRNPDSLNEVLEFRQAIAFALDRQAIVREAGNEYLTASQGFVGAFNQTASSQPWSAYETDLAKARELLETACTKAQRDCVASPPMLIFSTTANADFRPRLADQLEIQLEKVGIDVELQLEDSQVFFGDTLDTGNWDVGLWAWVGAAGTSALVDIFDVFAPGELPPDGFNYYNWGSPGSATQSSDAVAEFSELLARARSSVDSDEVLRLANRLEQILAEQAVIIPMNRRLSVGAFWADEIQGFRMNPSIAGHTWNIEHWYRVGE